MFVLRARWRYHCSAFLREHGSDLAEPIGEDALIHATDRRALPIGSHGVRYMGSHSFKKKWGDLAEIRYEPPPSNGFWIPGSTGESLIHHMALLAVASILAFWVNVWLAIATFFVLHLLIHGYRKNGCRDAYLRKSGQYFSMPVPPRSIPALHPQLIGKSARATTPMKPHGKVQVDGREFQAKAATGYIARDTALTVVGCERALLVVEPLQEPAAALYPE
ncbi:MAG: hypothetical protein GY851_34775 [bacterium]|nr:hypothetical protein [bacterium]